MTTPFAELAAVPAADEAPNGADHEQLQLDVRVKQMRREAKASEIIRRERAEADLSLPPKRTSYTLGSYMAEPKPDPIMRIECFQGENHLSVLGAMFKVGKTTLTANVARSFADGKPFLGTFAVTKPTGRVGFFNGEMDDRDVEKYLVDTGIKNVDAVAIWNLRGFSVDLLSDVGRDAAVDWLLENNVTYWVLDPWASVCAWSGVNEEKNPEVAPLVQRVFQIGQLAGVDNTLIVHHSGWEGNRLRGATALPSAADTLWQYTTDDDGVRELHAFGRGVADTKGVVTFENGQLNFTGLTRRAAKLDASVKEVLVYVRDNPEVNKTTLYTELPYGESKNRDAVKAALSRGLVTEEAQGRERRLRVNPEPPPEPSI